MTFVAPAGFGRGTTRSRVNFFLNKLKKLGFIECGGESPLKINSSLLSVVLHD
jgi:CRP/FNR family cyclic AMP-dependent transcriptional regulator